MGGRLSPRVEVGFVARAHGVRGELRIQPLGDVSDALGEADAVWLGEARFAVAGRRAVDGAWLLRVEGVADRDRAEALKGRAVTIAREAIGLEPGEWLLVDLIGCRCTRTDGAAWGTIVSIERGPQDRIVVRDGAVERQLPVVDAFLVEVDVEAGVVVVDPPEGLPEDPIA